MKVFILELYRLSVCVCACMASLCVVMCVCLSSGVFICRGKEDALVTKNMVVGESVYGEKRINVEVGEVT